MPVLRATVSIRGLYHYDNTIFDNMVLPTGVSKDILISNLLAELGELEVLYPDADYMKGLIGAWSDKEVGKWTELASILGITYNPINNFSKVTYHHRTDEEHSTDETYTSNNSNMTDETHTSDSGGDTTTTSVKGYNETSFVDSDQTATTTGNTGSKMVTNNKTDSGSKTDTGSKMNTLDYNQTVTGNIGRKSLTELILRELELREAYCIYDLIIKDFKLRFCILVY